MTENLEQQAAGSPKPRITFWRVSGVVIVTFGFLVLLLMTELFLIPQIAFTIVFGWISFLYQVIREIHPNPAEIISFLLVALLFLMLSHPLLKKLASSKNLKWNWGQSLLVFFGVMILFVVGTAMIGMTHQFTWLARSKEPLTQNKFRETVRQNYQRDVVKGVAEAVHNFSERHSTELPASTTFSENGTPLLSWATQLLPYLDETQLYESIIQAEPFDSLHNLPLSKTAIEAFRTHSHPTEIRGLGTNSYAWNAKLSGYNKVWKLSDITDGVSNTFIIGEVAVPTHGWAEPFQERDLSLGFGKEPNQFGSGVKETGWKKGPMIIFADGSVRNLNKETDLAILKALSTPNSDDFVGDF